MNGREKKEAKAKPQHQRRGGKKKGGNNDDDDHDDGSAMMMRDADLPDDYSIFGGSSVASSNDAGLLDDVGGFCGDGGDDNGDDGDLDGGGDAERAECAAANRASRLSDALSLASTLSSERRSAKREGVLRAMFRAVTTCATGPEGREILEEHWSSVWEACSCSFSGRGNAGPTEQYAACRVVEACSVVLGGDRDDVVSASNGPLRKVVNATGRATQVRGAALRCLSMVHFVCGTGCLETGEDSHSVLDLCEAVGGTERYRGDRTPPSLRATALDCWSLLCTTLHDAHVAGGGDGDGDADVGGGGGGGRGGGRGLRLLPSLATCLDSPDPGLRRSAGEAVSLIHECRLRMGIDDDEADNATERKFVRGSWDGSDQEALMDEIRERISELSATSSHRISKQARREQRSTFRDYASTVVEDEFPSEVVNWRGGKLTLNSWGEIVQLSFVRHCLQGGFQIQLMTNKTLHAIFGDALHASGGGGGGASSSLSLIEKRMFLSKTSEASKAADRIMTKQRRTRTNVKNHFLTSDGEDI